MQRISVVLIILVLTIFAPALADTEEGQKTISGTIVDVDWASSTLTIHYFDGETGTQDEINIKVPSNAKLTRGAKAIYFSDILQGDIVTVTYYDDGLSGLKAKRVSDSNLGNK